MFGRFTLKRRWDGAVGIAALSGRSLARSLGIGRVGQAAPAPLWGMVRSASPRSMGKASDLNSDWKSWPSRFVEAKPTPRFFENCRPADGSVLRDSAPMQAAWGCLGTTRPMDGREIARGLKLMFMGGVFISLIIGPSIGNATEKEDPFCDQIIEPDIWRLFYEEKYQFNTGAFEKFDKDCQTNNFDTSNTHNYLINKSAFLYINNKKLQAFRILNKLNNENNNIAALSLYMRDIYASPKGEKIDSTLKKVTGLSSKGFLPAQIEIAKFNLNNGKDLDKAKTVFEKGLSQGLPDAGFNLGVMYYMGLGVEQDKAKALLIFRKITKSKRPFYYSNVANIYIVDEELRNYEEARKFYELGALANDAVSLANLGRLLLYPEFGKIDINKTLDIYCRKHLSAWSEKVFDQLFRKQISCKERIIK